MSTTRSSREIAKSPDKKYKPFIKAESYQTTSKMTPLLLTGPPGCGKTTIVQKLATILPGAEGFFTEEIREAGVRKGFRLIDIATGEVRVLAHVDMRGANRGGKYGVDIGAFESFLNKLHVNSPLVLIDEIGKMECLSPQFRMFVERLLRSDKPVIATIAQHGTPFIESLKKIPDMKIIQVILANRNALPEKITEML